MRPDRDGEDRDHRMDGMVPARREPADGMLYAEELRDPDSHEEGFQFWEAVGIVLSRKWLILAIVIVGLAAAALLSLRTTPMYRAVATIEIQSEEIQIMEGAAVDQPTIADDEFMATQYELLRSRSLAERVAELLNLPSDERYADQSLPRPARLRQAAGKIVEGLRVAPEGRSRVVRVEFVSPHKYEAARIANAVVENFIESNLERRYNTTAYAREFLEERLAATKAALEEKEAELVAYAEEAGILDLSTGEQNAASLEVTSIMSLNSELAAAESQRIEAEQVYREALSNPAVREIMDNEVLRDLRSRRSELQSEYAEKLGVFKPEYPDMKRLQTRIDRLDAEIEAERASILSALEGDYRAALAREQSLRERVDELAETLQDERDRRIQYTILQREVDTNRSQYDALLQRMKEVSIASGIGSSQVSVVDEALPPNAPFEPNIPRTMIQALVLSLAAGVGLAFGLNYIDDTIKTPEDLRNKLGLPVIGIIPKMAKKSERVTDALSDPKSGVSEAYLSARTALDFSTSHGTPKSLLLTSTKPSEGKTSSTIALASAYAKNGHQVLIIDADMRKPSFVVDKGQSIGLSGLLTQDVQLVEQVVRSNTPGLYLLPSGVVPPNPAELLSGPRLRTVIEEAEAHFDFVIIDSPPILSFVDAPVLGTVCEGALIVIEAGSIRRPAVERTVNRLLESRTNLIGAILMKFDAKKAGYDYGYYYAAYGGAATAYVDDKGSKSGASRRKIRIEAAAAEEMDDRPDREQWG
jgi:capsular exopolysaccharide synthesis family protein